MFENRIHLLVVCIFMDIEIITEVNKVSERIQKLRQERRMSQMDLALEAGISQGFLAMIETGRKVPTIQAGKSPERAGSRPYGGLRHGARGEKEADNRDDSKGFETIPCSHDSTQV